MKLVRKPLIYLFEIVSVDVTNEATVQHVAFDGLGNLPFRCKRVDDNTRYHRRQNQHDNETVKEVVESS